MAKRRALGQSPFGARPQVTHKGQVCYRGKKRPRSLPEPSEVATCLDRTWNVSGAVHFDVGPKDATEIQFSFHEALYDAAMSRTLEI